MEAAGLAFCGDDYPYGLESSAVSGPWFFTYCTSEDRTVRQIRRFSLDGSSSSSLADVPTSRAWNFEAAGSTVFWQQKSGGDNFVLKAARSL